MNAYETIRAALEMSKRASRYCVLPGLERKTDEALAALADLERAAGESVGVAAMKTENAHPDDAAVDEFSAMMKGKLASAREKGRSGWRDPAWTAADINRHMYEHAAKGDPLDVAAYAMFLALRGEATIAPFPSPLDEAKNERNAIVKWLRNQADELDWDGSRLLCLVAQKIAFGDHRGTEHNGLPA